MKTALNDNLNLHGANSNRRKGFILRAIITLTVLFGVFSTSAATGTYIFLGTGNDGYFPDASGMWNALREQQGWEDAQHSLRSNYTGTQMRNDISWLQQAGPGDVAIWFYSGHGGQIDYDWDWDEYLGSSGDFFDESIGLQNRTGWATDDEITDAFDQLDPRVPIVVIMDTCHAGGFVGGLYDLNRLDNVVALLSCEEGQNSYSINGDTFSLFTAGLVAALGAGLPSDINHDGILYCDEWFNYAAAQIPWEYDQDPVYWTSPGLERIAIVIPEPATVVLLGIGSLVLCRRWVQLVRFGQRGI